VTLTGWAVAVLLVSGASALKVGAQESPGAIQKEQGPAVGERAPEFSLTGATRAGVRPSPVKLRDFKGKTVVLAFFYKARTKG
jgi:hypothetical protein